MAVSSVGAAGVAGRRFRRGKIQGKSQREAGFRLDFFRRWFTLQKRSSEEINQEEM